jgi:Ca-activated chloride channel homolog
MNAISFARPSFVYLLIAVPVLLLLMYRASRSRTSWFAKYGRPETVAGLSSLDHRVQRRSRLALLLGVSALAVAVAGPRYGKGGDTGIIVGRDLMIVLDLSKSMLADDMADVDFPKRWQAARAGAKDLVDAARRDGGHRIGVVAFAARPVLICPPTSDYDHVLARIEEFSPLAPPTEIRPEPEEAFPGGTSIGASIRNALAAFDPKFLGYQDVILFTDGDGPGVEREIEAGVADAVSRQVPVHLVGLGDPTQGKVLTFGDGDNVEIISTKLQEEILKEIARRTRGEYYPSRREVPKMGEWFDQILLPRPSRELEDDLIPQPKDRSIWFAGLGLIFLGLAWWREG